MRGAPQQLPRVTFAEKKTRAKVPKPNSLSLARSPGETYNFKNIAMLIHTLEEGGRNCCARPDGAARASWELADKFV